VSRTIRDWKLEKVADFEVAPHRYLHSGAITPNGVEAKDIDDCESWSEFKANTPYVEGEVVYVQWGHGFKKARITGVFREYDRFGFRRAVYHVQYETKAGYWSKRWDRAYAGYIQRGYKNAGLAPDVP